MQRVFHRLAKGLMHPLREQAVEAGALIHLVEVRQWPPLEDRLGGADRRHRGPLGIVEHSLHQIAGRQQILKTLLVLDADQIAAEAVGEAERGDIHLALHQHLGSGEIGFLVATEVKFHAGGFEPAKHLPRLTVRHADRLVKQGALAEPLLEHAGGMEEMVGDDGVVHPHAALVENTHQRLAAAQVGRDAGADLRQLGRHFYLGHRDRMAGVVVHLAGVEPGLEMAVEAGAGKIVGPQRGIGHARLGERAIEIEHPDQPRPLPRPVRHREDWAGVR